MKTRVGANTPPLRNFVPMPPIKPPKEEEETYKLAPKGCAVLALLDCGLIADIDDARIDGFWTIFEKLMEDNDYIKE